MARKSNTNDHDFYNYYLWDYPQRSTPEERLYQAAQTVRKQYRVTKDKDCAASFYPYVGLKSTIKMEKRCILIRISDILSDAPVDVLSALMHILLARVLRKKVDEDQLFLYRNYIHQPEVEARHAEARSKRSKKILLGVNGKYFNLDDSFNRINRRYFQGSMIKPSLSWSPRSSRRLLGYHDSHLNLVVISRWLDRKTVPQYVLDYIMYHELLHITMPAKYINGKRIVHTKEFKHWEQKFEQYGEAIHWLSR